MIVTLLVLVVVFLLLGGISGGFKTNVADYQTPMGIIQLLLVVAILIILVKIIVSAIFGPVIV